MKITKSQLRKLIKEQIKAEAMEEEPAREEILYDFRVRLYDPKTNKMTGKTARVDARDRDHAREMVNNHLEQKGSDLRASSDVYNMDVPAD